MTAGLGACARLSHRVTVMASHDLCVQVVMFCGICFEGITSVQPGTLHGKDHLYNSCVMGLMPCTIAFQEEQLACNSFTRSHLSRGSPCLEKLPDLI